MAVGDAMADLNDAVTAAAWAKAQELGLDKTGGYPVALDISEVRQMIMAGLGAIADAAGKVPAPAVEAGIGPAAAGPHGGEWRRTWADIPYTGGANGVRIDPPDGAGWELLQTLHIPAAPAGRKGTTVRLGSMVHVWYRPAAGPRFGV